MEVQLVWMAMARLWLLQLAALDQIQYHAYPSQFWKQLSLG
jgi:hypothetical protein